MFLIILKVLYYVYKFYLSISSVYIVRHNYFMLYKITQKARNYEWYISGIRNRLRRKLRRLQEGNLRNALARCQFHGEALIANGIK